MLAAGGGDSQQQREEKRIGSNVLVGSIHPSFVNSRVNVERIRWQCVFCYFAQAVILVLDSTQPSRRRGAWPWGGVNSESVHMATKPATHPRVNLAVTPLLVTPYSSWLSSHTGIRRELTLSLSLAIYIFPGKCHCKGRRVSQCRWRGSGDRRRVREGQLNTSAMNRIARTMSYF